MMRSEQGSCIAPGSKAMRRNARLTRDDNLPSLSVIIPTKNRPLDLELTVKSLLTQTALPQQLIIIDQSRNQESRMRVTSAYEDAPASVRDKTKLCYALDPSISGLAAARNRAIQLAEGNVWLFLDDDVVAEPDFLREILAVYESHPNITGVSGIVTNYRPPSWSFRLWNSIFVCGPFADDRQPVYWAANHPHNGEPVQVSRLGGGLMSFRAEAVRGCRFDETLLGVSDGEDVDFCARLGPGAVLLIAPRARLAHNRSPAGREREHWLRREARSTHYLYWRNWDRGLRNRLCFWWLNVGYAVVATLAGLRRASLQPWRAFTTGAREGRCASRAVV